MGNNLKSSSPQKTGEESQRTKDIRNLAEYIKSDKCKKVVLMLGAGVSTSAGIPDFRSPKTGLYSNLARLNIPYPEAVFEINYFRRNPLPFYTLAAELYPGSFRPTPTHTFVKLLATHDHLSMCFTQNIDTLERQAGVPAEKIVEAHGSFATQRCVDCKTPFPDDEMREIVLEDRAEGEVVRIPWCKRDKCGGVVKPDIVFFGEALPERFITSMPIVGSADLLIIIGTSLTVHPFASLAEMADRRKCRRVLINLERVGDLGRRPSDVVLLGECDAIVRKLCKALGWGEELESVWAETALDGAKEEEVEEVVAVEEVAVEEVVVEVDKVEVEKVEVEKMEVGGVEKVGGEDKGREESEKELEKEVEKITDAIGKRLDLDETKGTESDATKGDSAASKEEDTEVLHIPSGSTKPVDVGKL